MRKKLTRKDKDAGIFESILTKENKAIIERVLNSIDRSPSYSARSAFEPLDFIIGRRPSVFLRNLLEANNTDFIRGIKGISPETRKYLSLLYANYGYKLRGTLHRRNVAYPHAWRSLDLISTKYDVTFELPFMKLEMVKENNECVAIEDSFDSFVQLLSNIIEYLADESSKIVKFQKNLGVRKSSMKELIESVNKFDRVVSLQKT